MAIKPRKPALGSRGALVVGNSTLRRAAAAKNDEFYTQLSDIEKELGHYKEHFSGKVVFCNCDDPESSNFWRYFDLNFEYLGLARLVSTHYEPHAQSYKLEIIRGNNGAPRIVKTALAGDGDFRSAECVDILESADIVVTNPPFSLFREYVAQLVEHGKKFIILGNNNAISYKEIFKLIMADKLWLGVRSNITMEFELAPGYATWKRKDDQGRKFTTVPSISWFTNLQHAKRNDEMILYCAYNEKEYPKYANYSAIEVRQTSRIPADYRGLMGVPITFLCKYNPRQFSIVDISPHFFCDVERGAQKPDQLRLDGQKDPYARILIRRNFNDEN